MDDHKLLQMQLKKCHLDADVLPSDVASWKSFIERVNRSYHDNDNDRYLLERSMQVSSGEMKLLNEMLETAQKIARMGYWHYDIQENKITWSKQAYYMFGIDAVDNIAGIEGFYLLILEDKVDSFKKKIKKSINDGNEFECELQIKNIKNVNQVAWYRIIGKPVFDAIANKVTAINFVSIDISSRKIDEEELKRLNGELVISARRAGMADIAISVLHNVGNILNSANVSSIIISENINDKAISKLSALKELFVNHLDNIGDYLSTDEKGKLIPQYFILLAEKINHVHELIKSEIVNLNDHLQHIKDITAMQKDISGISTNMNENLFVNDLIDSALMMCDPMIKPHVIKVVKNYRDNIFISSDRSKILQILVNMIKNAIESLLSVLDDREKQLILSCGKLDSDTVSISVQDNGVGIAPEVMSKIYNFGFTTKPQGHGFGMHSSCLTAKELHGELSATSDGVDKGALFVLTLPITDAKSEVHDESKYELENHRN